MFLGEYQHSLDAKGRIILPARYRARLSDGCVLTKGQDSCLYGYPKEEWERVASRLGEAKISSQQARDFNRVFFSGSHEDSPDQQGRVSIPEPLRRYARLERDVVIIGAGPRFEIWERAVWERHREQAERQFSEVAEAHPDLPF